MSDQLKTPARIIELAKKQHEEAKVKKEQALKRVPEKYHDFLMDLPKDVPLCAEVVPIDQEAEELGIFTNENGTYVKVWEPYLGVDGRVLWARDEHKELGKKLDMKREVIGQMVVWTVTSEVYGTAMGSAALNRAKDYKGYELQSVETAGLGRALGFMGYGLIGTGIASAEEVQYAIRMREQENKVDQNPIQQGANTQQQMQNGRQSRAQQQNNQNPNTQRKENETNQPHRDQANDRNHHDEEELNQILYRILKIEHDISSKTGTSYFKVAIEDEEGNQFDAVAVGNVYRKMSQIQISSNAWYHMRFEFAEKGLKLISSIQEVKRSA
jgi:hypothetical protein